MLLFELHEIFLYHQWFSQVRLCCLQQIEKINWNDVWWNGYKIILMIIFV